MKRTRKWAFVAQEATRLAGLGLSPVDIAKRLTVKRSTVQRWMAAGKIVDTRRGVKAARLPKVTRLVKPSEWSAAVRGDYALDATDNQLVTLAEYALGKALDADQSVAVQLAAMRTFQGLVKQLALVAKSADVPADEKPAAERAAARRPLPARSAGDPRALLMVVK